MIRDEFYTCLKDIESELNNNDYREFLKNKIIFCNCDDKFSDFYLFFKNIFISWNLKEVIFVSLKSNKYLKFVNKNNNLIELEFFIKDGDFRSEESIFLLKNSDVVITNPPFSLFQEFILLLYKYNKKFLIIGPNNAISYRNIFNLIKENKLWFGFNFNKSLYFKVPKNYDNLIQIEGEYYCKVHQISWFTNILIKKQIKKNWKRYIDIKDKVNKYYNYEGIDINDCNNIPIDYKGIMGVPITFLGNYDSNMFEILDWDMEKKQKN